MRKLALASTLALSLTGCTFVGGALYGSAQWGDDFGMGLADGYALATLGSGTSVVCLGSDIEVPADQDLFEIRGEVVSDEMISVDVGNVIPCEQDPARVLTVVDGDGATWEIGYAWYAADGYDLTPVPDLVEGQQVMVTVRQGASGADSTSAGFVVDSSRDMIYAMEAGHGEAGLASGDIADLDVSATREAGSIESDCGENIPLIIDFESSSDALSLYPGEDAGMEIDGEYYVTCNINSLQVADDCEDDGEISYVLFK
ncbi:MAG: hypothetical protein GY913_29330 [Proteobacteria bacterium]|nr:hypothetical protein [Pseudomonadota bacterium]MCP4921018.1 hypothetical protein [Pseudomonadota bacterium]